MPRADRMVFLYPYYINKEMLRFQLQTWCEYTPDVQKKLKVVIVDDGSPSDPASELIVGREFPFELELYRILVDIPYNQHGARNLGFHVVEPGWVFASDMDHVVPREMASELFDVDLEPSHYYRVPRKRAKTHGLADEPPDKRIPANIFLVQRSAFWKAGGYDEDFCGSSYAHSLEKGCYGGDTQFIRTLNAVAREAILSGIYIVRYNRNMIPDASCRGEMREAVQNNGIYVREYEYRIDRKRREGDLMPRNPLRFEWSRIV